MTANEWNETYGLQRGFDKSESEFFFELVGLGHNIDTLNDTEYQKRLFEFIESIIYNDNLDYISKLDKIHLLVDSNICRQKFRTLCFTKNIDEDRRF